MQLTILGSSSATPTLHRHQTAQVLTHNGKHYLLDCGESAQLQMLRYGINQHKVAVIFISHLHPDHFTGLIGYITTQSLQRRERPLHVYGPAGLQTIIETQLSYTGSRLSYPLHFHSIDGLADGEVLFEDEQVQVSGLNLEHGVPCYGFLFTERHKRFKLDKSTVQKYPPPVPAYPYLQNGYDYTDQAGKLYKADTYILRNPEKRSFAYLTDTLVQPHLTQWLKGVTVLYHEATFTSELIERARKTHHTTSAQAAALARDSKVQQLLIGHFSARYGNLEPLLAEAKETFANTALAEEGCTFEIRQANATETLS